MFLIRTAFWLALVVLLLPTDPRAQSDLMSKVSYVAHQAATFCDRNQTTCTRANEAWGVFKTKLEFAGRLAGDVVSRYVFGRGEPRPPTAVVPRPATAAADTPAAQGAAATPVPARATLTPSDLGPPWRGPTTKSGT